MGYIHQSGLVTPVLVVEHVEYKPVRVRYGARCMQTSQGRLWDRGYIHQSGAGYTVYKSLGGLLLGIYIPVSIGYRVYIPMRVCYGV